MTLNIEGKGETGVAITLDVPKNDESWDNFDERNVILYDSNKLKIKTVEEKKLTEVINISLNHHLSRFISDSAGEKYCQNLKRK